MEEQRHDGVAESVERGWGRLRLVPEWLWWPINAVQLVFTLLWSAGCITLALLVWLVFGSERIPLRMAAWLWAPGLILGAGARLKVSGLENVDFSKPHMLVANHQSMIEICALFMAVPVPLRFMLKASLGRVPFLGWYTRAMGMILLQRGNSAAVTAQLEHAAGLLRDGHSLAAFPEGTRSRDGGVRAFKAGAFQAAIEAGVPILPVAIEGSGRVMPPGGFSIRPGTIRLAFGQPIATDGLGAADRRALARRAQVAVSESKRRID
ncbi:MULTISPECIES: lysophospholipid acyltransferase family protein [unclassified Wenzhouxiangella]|uniref:lysophospholipid acyltransferase family protein n=1 Tax=unclassified Wenzhouxiangella TaxID=2613841 RepID=UPI000E3297C1|nr:MULTISPECIES: lysophospholipid acyltransferase family protein [unclassified Wenzhouxiangella]RFF27517.1 1-acyl-sn-glycerol-3-phosphate acyltransferase [Wenzhouxiangella sp. 15181]RFP69621.1 1-acyl-sn-glycerol-3-phosphate acyltransferase [Wenzhouxiangella sp. 15190]